MQPDPATPRSLLLNGLTDEERAGLMAIEAARQAQASSTPHATTPAVKKAAPNRGNTRPRAGAPDAPTPTTPASPAVQISPSLYTSPLRIGGTLVSLSDADPSAPAEGDCPLVPVPSCSLSVTLVLQVNVSPPTYPRLNPTRLLYRWLRLPLLQRTCSLGSACVLHGCKYQTCPVI